MRQTTPLFIGYRTLEDWAATRDREKPVLVMPLVEQGTEQCGMRTDILLVVCQQVDDGGHVHYCRLWAASLTRCHGEPFDPDWREREAAWQSLAAAVEAQLSGLGLVIRCAVIAASRDLRLLEGRADCICFDRQTRRYLLQAT